MRLRTSVVVLTPALIAVLVTAQGAAAPRAPGASDPADRTHEQRSADVVAAPAVAPPRTPSGRQGIYWGATIDGARYGRGYGDPPWDMRGLDAFEASAGRRVSILHWGAPWSRRGQRQPFFPRDYSAARARGAIPMVDWNPWDLAARRRAEQPRFRLATIIRGDHDDYVRQWADGARRWGAPLLLRFGHEMNGSWYPWSEAANGNRTGEFARAWRHVRRIFRDAGATNVSWVWSVNTEFPGSLPLRGLYPGPDQVDWVAVDAYNWGQAVPFRRAPWRTLAAVLDETYRALADLAPAKPMMLSEIGVSEHGGSKATWVRDALTTLPDRYPRVAATVWFNRHDDGVDWTIESSVSARQAFSRGLRNPRFLSGVPRP